MSARRTSALLLSAALLAGCGTPAPAAEPAAPAAPPALSVVALPQDALRTSTVARELPGTVAHAEEIQVVALAPGTVTSVAGKLGDAVEKSAVLAGLDEDQQSITRTNARGATKLKLHAEAALSRTKDATAAQVAQAESGVKLAEASLALAKRNQRALEETLGNAVKAAELTVKQAELAADAAADGADINDDVASITEDRAEAALDAVEDARARQLRDFDQSKRDTEQQAVSVIASVAALDTAILDGVNLQTGFIDGSGITVPYAADLGNANPSLVAPARSAMTAAWTAALALRNQPHTGTLSDVQQALGVAQSVVAATEAVRRVLESTTPTDALPLTASQGGTSLTSLRGDMEAAHAQALGATTQLGGSLGGLQAIERSRSTLESSLDAAVDEAERQVDLADAGTRGSTVSATTQRDASRIAKELAQTQLASTRSSTAVQRDAAALQVTLAELQVQGAKNARSAAAAGRESQLEGLRAQVTQAEMQSELAKIQLDRLLVRAPIDGTISAALVDIGATVGAGQPLFTIAGEGPRIVRFSAATDEAPLLAPDTKVSVRTATGLEEPATITRIAPGADTMTRTVRVEAKLAARSALLPGSAVTVSLATTRTPLRDDAFFVPIEALTITQTSTTVYVVEGSTATRVPATVHAVLGGQAEITLDSPTDALVVIDGADLLREGATVTLRSADTPAS